MKDGTSRGAPGLDGGIDDHNNPSLIRADNESRSEAFNKIIAETKVKFGGLGPAVTNMRTGLKEAEKEASKFMQAFQKKTKVDAIVDSFVAIENI